MRALRLAPLVLALVAACTVDTASLKPTTDAECVAKDAASKACGYKCVPVDDVQTGCAAPGACSPCPAGNAAIHTVAFCSAGACALDCEVGWGDCDGIPENGCETRVDGNDAAHCGVCLRACTGCTAGSCPGTAISFTPPPAYPRGIVNHGGNLFYVEDSGGGLLRNAETGAVVASGLGYHCDWPYSLAPVDEILVTGQVPTTANTYGFDLALFTVADPAGASTWSSAVVGAPLTFDEYIDGIVHDGTNALFSFTQSDGVYAWAAGTPAARVASGSRPRGLATHGGRTYFGTSAGEVRYLEDVGGVGVYQSGVIASAPVQATRLAVYSNTTYFTVPLLFWIAEADGSVYGARADGIGGVVTLVPPASPPSPAYNVDLTADAEGVYWSNWNDGWIGMWRASDDRVLPVAHSSSPRGIAVRGSTIYWTDGWDNQIYSAPIPLR